MFDTIRLNIPQESVPEIDLLSEIPARFESPRFGSDGDRYWYTGYHHNLMWSVNHIRLSIAGSLCKYHYGNNYENIGKVGVSKALNSLSEVFGINIFNAKVTQMDFAINFFLNNEPKHYYKYLGKYPYIQNRHINNDGTLTYRNKSKELQFYDKIIELLEKNNLPEHLIHKYLMRFEVKYRKNIKQYFNNKNICARDLCDEGFFEVIKNKLEEEFFSIKQIKNFQFDKDQIGTPKDYQHQLAALGLKSIGENTANEIIEELFDNSSSGKKKRYRCRIANEKLNNCATPKLGDDMYFELASSFKNTLHSINNR